MGKNDVILVLLFLSEDYEKNVLKKIYEISNKLILDNRVEIVCGISDMYSKITDTLNAVVQATVALDYNKLRNNETIFWYRKIPRNNEWYYYPYDLEQNLINFVSSKNKDGVHSLLSELYRENIINRELRPDVIEKFIIAIACTLHRIIERKEENEDIFVMLESLESGLRPEEAFKIINKCFDKLTSVSNEFDGSKALLTVEKAVKYIDENFSDSDISVKSIAEKFSISEKYFSAVFKQRFGETVSKYIEIKRIEFACECLLTDKIQVYDIAHASGYKNDMTFRRAFKKVKGISPKEYRNSFA